MQSESQDGGQAMSTPVYSWLLDPAGHIVHTESPRSHDEASFRLQAHNSGPWQLCFKQRVDKGNLGSTFITLSYFSVTEGKAAEQQGYRSQSQQVVTVDSLPSQAHIRSLTETVASIDESLQVIERQQRHFLRRTEKHVQYLNDSQHNLFWWKSIHVLSVFGAIAVHRAFVTHMQSPTPSEPPASLV